MLNRAFAKKPASCPFILRVLLLNLMAVSIGYAQTESKQETTRRTIIGPERALGGSDVGQTKLQCAGYFRMPALKDLPQIVGGEQEQEKNEYATGDYVYLNAGAQKGTQVGQEFHVIRPRGEPKWIYKSKEGDLGIYVQEVGQLQVIRVKDAVSVAQIKFACEEILLGDLLTGVPDRVSANPRMYAEFDRFADPSGKATGMIVMAKGGREMVSVGDTIYVDIGDEDKAEPGNYVTIYRPLGTGNLDVDVHDLATGSREGFASRHYLGGGYSIKARRAKDSKELINGEGIYREKPVTQDEIEDHRPRMPRKILGEAMIINVQVRTATAIITSVAQEVHTGDRVELK